MTSNVLVRSIGSLSSGFRVPGGNCSISGYRIFSIVYVLMTIMQVTKLLAKPREFYTVHNLSRDRVA